MIFIIIVCIIIFLKFKFPLQYREIDPFQHTILHGIKTILFGSAFRYVKFFLIIRLKEV
jgi:hypothetical protein